MPDEPPRTLRRFRFTRSARLRSAADFREVRLNGKSWTGKFFVLAVLRGGDQLPARLGIITTRRLGIAVLRNRVRRQIREIFRRHQHRIARGVCLVTIARQSALVAALSELERDWLRLAERASILAAAA